jgi:hypothetical protein
MDKKTAVEPRAGRVITSMTVDNGIMYVFCSADNTLWLLNMSGANPGPSVWQEITGP